LLFSFDALTLVVLVGEASCPVHKSHFISERSVLEQVKEDTKEKRVKNGRLNVDGGLVFNLRWRW